MTLQVVMRTSDPALPRIGTDYMTLRVVMRTSDPALPRIGTDFMTLRVVLRTSDPALPRIGTDFMTLRVVMRIIHQQIRLAVISSRRASSHTVLFLRLTLPSSQSIFARIFRFRPLELW